MLVCIIVHRCLNRFAAGNACLRLGCTMPSFQLYLCTSGWAPKSNVCFIVVQCGHECRDLHQSLLFLQVLTTFWSYPYCCSDMCIFAMYLICIVYMVYVICRLFLAFTPSNVFLQVVGRLFNYVGVKIGQDIASVMKLDSNKYCPCYNLRHLFFEENFPPTATAILKVIRYSSYETFIEIMNHAYITHIHTHSRSCPVITQV